jgi:hypothetical protein
MPDLIATTIRFSQGAHALLVQEAERAGTPLAQYVRAAAMVRAILQQAEREDSWAHDVSALAAAVAALAHANHEPPAL